MPQSHEGTKEFIIQNSLPMNRDSILHSQFSIVLWLEYKKLFCAENSQIFQFNIINKREYKIHIIGIICIDFN